MKMSDHIYVLQKLFHESGAVLKLDLYSFIIWIHVPNNIWHFGCMFYDPKPGLAASEQRAKASEFHSWEENFFPQING
jgi:hypothetical protein